MTSQDYKSECPMSDASQSTSYPSECPMHNSNVNTENDIDPTNMVSYILIIISLLGVFVMCVLVILKCS